ncbi:MAG: transcription antiterminator [Enterococcus lacertideformus]|uniref:Ascorbate-specific PTS system EIIA component n=1 Tax=Enterococcus lacertideformus TaxID=2771493 RepID=A0A931AVZ1_9ENTE|nr:transcription antiterminator [Enterococcus lacertideformus]
MDETITYLLKNYSDKELSWPEVSTFFEKPMNEVKSHLLPFCSSYDEFHLKLKKIKPVEWVETFLGLSRYEVVYTEKERNELLYLMVYSEKEALSVFHFQEFLKVSKGTVLSDIKKVREALSIEICQLLYSRKEGFALSGSEFYLRREAKNRLASLLQTINGRFGVLLWLTSMDFILVSHVKQVIIEACLEKKIQLAPSRMEELAFFYSLTKKRIGHSILEEQDGFPVIHSNEIASISESILLSITEIPVTESEIQFFSRCLMTFVQGNLHDQSHEFLFSCVAEIIHHMETLVAVRFESFKELFDNLYFHLVPAYYRMIYGFYLPNPMIKQIKRQYGAIYELTTKALQPFEKIIGRKIPEEEIGFFSILFGGEIRKINLLGQQKKIRAIVLCPSGISSSLILKSELRHLFPTLFFTQTDSIDRLHEIDEATYDIIFSTVKINQIPLKKSFYLVKPIMSDLEKNKLLNRVQNEWLIPGFSLPSAKEILDAIKPYIRLREGIEEEKIYHIINRKINKSFERKEDCRPMLSELITPEMIQLAPKQVSWKKAITLAAKPLLDTEKITTSYIEAMIDRVNQYGAFIYIGDRIALSHARPEDGVNELGMSLLKLEGSVNLLDEKHPVQLFICLAAIDNDAHLRALANLTKLLSKKENLQALLHAQSKEEIIKIIKKGDE